MKRSILILAGCLTCVCLSPAFAKTKKAPKAPVTHVIDDRDEPGDEENIAADIKHAEDFLHLTFLSSGLSEDGKTQRWTFTGPSYHGLPILVDIAIEASDEEMNAAAVAVMGEVKTIYEWSKTNGATANQ